MLFTDETLAARIERAEGALLTDAARAAARRRPDAGAFVREIAGGVATYSGSGSPLNKLFGLGFGRMVKEHELDEVERAFGEREAPVQAEVASLADPAVAEMLTRRGYVLKNVEHVLGRTLETVEERPTVSGMEISVDDGESVERWLDVLVTGFAAPDGQGIPSHESFPREVLEQPIGDMAAGQGFRRYVAYREGILAGGGGLRVGDGVGLLCGAATLPEHRRRGVQGALLSRRLADAAGLGCDVAVVTTQPGSKSQRNVQRHGFGLLYTRAVLVREN